MFGSGLPSSSTRLNRVRTEVNTLSVDNLPMDMEQVEEEKAENEEPPWAYLDFQIVKKIFYLYSVTTKMSQSAQQYPDLAWRTPDP